MLNATLITAVGSASSLIYSIYTYFCHYVQNSYNHSTYFFQKFSLLQCVFVSQWRTFNSIFFFTCCPETVNAAEEYVFTLVIKNSFFLAEKGSWWWTGELHQHEICSLQPVSVACVVDEFSTFLGKLWSDHITFNQTKSQDQQHGLHLSYSCILYALNMNAYYQTCMLLESSDFWDILSGWNSWNWFCIMLTLNNQTGSCKTGCQYVSILCWNTHIVRTV